MSLFGSVGKVVAAPFTAGASLLGGSGLFGTQQGTVPYNNSFSNTSTFNPFAQSYLGPAFNQAHGVFGSGNTLLGPAMDVTQRTLSGDFLNPESNPYFKASVNDALGLAGSAFAGQYGGAAGTNLGNTGYQEVLARTLGTLATNAYSNNFQTERNNQLSAIPFAGSLPYANITGYEQALAPGLTFGTTGASGTGQNQQPYYQNNTATTLGSALGLGMLGHSLGLFGGGTAAGAGAAGGANLAALAALLP